MNDILELVLNYILRTSLGLQRSLSSDQSMFSSQISSNDILFVSNSSRSSLCFFVVGFNSMVSLMLIDFHSLYPQEGCIYYSYSQTVFPWVSMAVSRQTFNNVATYITSNLISGITVCNIIRLGESYAVLIHKFLADGNNGSFDRS